MLPTREACLSWCRGLGALARPLAVWPPACRLPPSPQVPIPGGPPPPHKSAPRLPTVRPRTPRCSSGGTLQRLRVTNPGPEARARPGPPFSLGGLARDAHAVQLSNCSPPLPRAPASRVTPFLRPVSWSPSLWVQHTQSKRRAQAGRGSSCCAVRSQYPPLGDGDEPVRGPGVGARVGGGRGSREAAGGRGAALCPGRWGGACWHLCASAGPGPAPVASGSQAHTDAGSAWDPTGGWARGWQRPASLRTVGCAPWCLRS